MVPLDELRCLLVESDREKWVLRALHSIYLAMLRQHMYIELPSCCKKLFIYSYMGVCVGGGIRKCRQMRTHTSK